MECNICGHWLDAHVFGVTNECTAMVENRVCICKQFTFQHRDLYKLSVLLGRECTGCGDGRHESICPAQKMDEL